jgi:hypothetical protein
MLKSEMNENKLQDGYYLICKLFNEVFYCMMDGDATLKRAEAAVFGDKQAITSRLANFAQDVFEYAGAPVSIKKVMSKMRIVPCAKLSEALVNEDFGMGVGAPVGADQGIPYGGDGKAVVPCYMGCTSRHGTVNKATGFGGILWPKRKKRRKRRYPNFVQEAYDDDYTLTAVNIAEFLEEQGVDDSVYRVEETDDNNIIVTLNADPVETNYVQDTNNLFAEISIIDYNSSDVIIINIDRLTQTASIRIADEDTVSGMACANMQDFENVWNTLNNLTEQ